MSQLLLEFEATADAVERDCKYVTIGRTGGPCERCRTPMRRAEYRATHSGPVLLKRDICPKCGAQTRVLSTKGGRRK